MDDEGKGKDKGKGIEDKAKTYTGNILGAGHAYAKASAGTLR